MNAEKNVKTQSWWQDMLKYILIIATIAFISFLFPGESYFNYKYQKGGSWNYDDLVAPFNFALNRSEDEISFERKKIEEDFVPVYTKDNKAIEIFNISVDNLDLSSIDNPADVKDFLKKEAAIHYRKGVLSIQDYNQVWQTKKELIISQNNVNTKISVQSVGNPEKLGALLTEELSLAFPDTVARLVAIDDLRLAPNLVYDREINETLLNDKLAKVSPVMGMVNKGEVIAAKGEILTEQTIQKIESYKTAYENEVVEKSSVYSIFTGYLLLTLLIIGVLLLYLQYHAMEVYEKWTRLSFILMWIVLFAYLVYVIEKTDTLSTYVLPFAIVPIIIKNFYKERLAMFVHIVIILVASFLSNLGYEFTVLQLLVGMVTVLVVSETRYWNRFFYGILFIVLTYFLGYFGLSLINTGSIYDTDWHVFIWLFINGMLTLLAYPFIPLLEKLFGFTSQITLAELGDINRPLLKELSLKAPGTMQHSLQVSHLATAAADAIGAKSLLVKVGALYHDIGKVKNPECFIENQRNGINPHSEWTNFESAEKIISHVTDGKKMAKKSRLPHVLIDFIMTHHGTTRTEYFYRNQLNQFPDKEFDETLFRYPGPKPRTKEEAILMLADSLEAASKSLKNPTGKDIDDLVDKIIAYKIEEHQLDDAELTFQELKKCEDTFKSTLRSMNHIRVEYPELNEK
jgi:putative nucleotidyltransferase with HDIG domain